jgi:hypothetical protein
MTRIPYAYSLADNNAQFLRLGYGLTVGDATFSEFEFCNRVSERDFTVIFSREVPRTDSSFTETDSVVVSLLEDVNTAQGLFFSYQELGIDSNILKIDIGSTSGVQEVVAGNSKFLTMSASFLIQIKESL